MTLTDLRPVLLEDWGTIEYGTAWERQETILADNLRIKQDWKTNHPDAPPAAAPTTSRLVLCTHPHVYTLGKSGHMTNLLLGDERMKELDVAFYQTNRGGDITYHGPGQIVGYPLLDLEKFKSDLGWYMSSLEEVIIRTIAHYGLKGERLKGSVGVWLDADNPAKARKICAMGVRCSRWLTIHGFALNVNTNLNYFNHIVPCGIVDKGVTSMFKELLHEVNETALKGILIQEFASVFGADFDGDL
jgi:lipoyl(octanoyl) transferase